MVSLTRGRPLILQEVGYPAATSLGSSEHAQAQFVTNVFKERVTGYIKKQGYSEEVTCRIAEETISNSDRLTEFLAREEYGLHEDYMSEPRKAALYSGAANLIGALAPVFPYFLTPNISTAILFSLIFATLSLIITGFIVSLVANTSTKSKIAEMVVSGLGSASVS